MTEMRWNRKAVSLGSPEDADKRRPKQAKNLSPSSLIGPKVSIATGQNKYVRLSSWYLSFFNFIIIIIIVVIIIIIIIKNNKGVAKILIYLLYIYI